MKQKVDGHWVLYLLKLAFVFSLHINVSEAPRIFLYHTCFFLKCYYHPPSPRQQTNRHWKCIFASDVQVYVPPFFGDNRHWKCMFASEVHVYVHPSSRDNRHWKSMFASEVQVYVPPSLETTDTGSVCF